MALGTHVQVWMFPGGAWNKVDTGSAWTRLMGVGWVVLGVVKTCSDGALDVRNMSCFFLRRLMHVSAQMFQVTCRVNKIGRVTVMG